MPQFIGVAAARLRHHLARWSARLVAICAASAGLIAAEPTLALALARLAPAGWLRLALVLAAFAAVYLLPAVSPPGTTCRRCGRATPRPVPR